MKKILILLALLGVVAMASGQEVEITKRGGNGATVYTSTDNMVSQFTPTLAQRPLQLWATCWDKRRGNTYRWNGLSWQPLDDGYDQGQKASVAYTVTNPAGNILTGWNPDSYNKARVNYTTFGVDTFYVDTLIFSGITVPGETFTIEFNTSSRLDADTLRIHFNSMFKDFYGFPIQEWICPPRGTMTMNFQFDRSVEGATLREIDDIMGSYGYPHGGGGGGSVTGAAQGLSVDAGVVELGNEPGETAAALTSDRQIPTNGNHVWLSGDAGGLQIGGGNNNRYSDALNPVVMDGTPLAYTKVYRGPETVYPLVITTDSTDKSDAVEFRVIANAPSFLTQDVKDHTFALGFYPTGPQALDSVGTIHLNYESNYQPGGLGVGPGLGEFQLNHNYVPSRVSTVAGTRVINYAGEHRGGNSGLDFNANIISLGDLEMRKSLTFFMRGNTFGQEYCDVARGLQFRWDSVGFYPLTQRLGSSARGLIGYFGTNLRIGDSANSFEFNSNGPARVLTPSLTDPLHFGDPSVRRIEKMRIFASSLEAFDMSTANSQVWGFDLNDNNMVIRDRTANTSPLTIADAAPNNAVFVTANGGLNVNLGNADLGRMVISGQRGTVGFRALAQNEPNGYSFLAAGTITGGAFLFGGNMSATQTLTGEVFNNNSSSTTAHSRVQVRTANASSSPYTQYSAAGAPDNWATGVNPTDAYAFRIQLTGNNPTTAAQGFRMGTNGQVRFSNYTSAAAFTGTTSHFITMDAAGNFITETAADFRTDIGIVDNSLTNEGQLGVGVGGANDALIVSNTSGNVPVTLIGGANINVNENQAAGTITISSPDTIFIKLTPLNFTDSLESVGQINGDYFNVPSELAGFRLAKTEYSVSLPGSGTGSVTVGLRAYSSARALSFPSFNTVNFASGEVIKTNTGAFTAAPGQLLMAVVTADTMVSHPTGLTLNLMFTR